MRKLGHKDLDTYIFIKEYIGSNNYPPTLREIVNNTNHNCISCARYSLEKLEELGFLKVDRNENDRVIARSIKVVSNDKTKKMIADLRSGE